MRRRRMMLIPLTLACAAVVLLAPGEPAAAQKNRKEAVTDAAEADADFAVQGEYAGKLAAEGKSGEFGVQVIALGGGKFRAVGYRGGLPGDGWDGSEKVQAEGETTDGRTAFPKFFGGAEIRDGAMTVTADGEVVAKLQRVLRKSKSLGAEPPEGAIVLFDGETNDFQPGKTTEDGLLTVPQRSRHVFDQDFTLHLEFRTPYKPYARGQGRGNSGAYLQGRYEIQVLDSFGLEGRKNECGGLYGRKDCDLNMCFPPLSWQTFDVDFQVARFGDDGKVVSPPTVTVRHNGIVIHDEVKLRGANRRGGPLTLQNHGNPVHYRNIWVLEREPAE